MSFLPPTIRALVEAFGKLPGIGNKSAHRLVFHLINRPAEEVLALSEALRGIKERLRNCRTCYNYSEDDLCPICASANRDPSIICVVEQPTDIQLFERIGSYRGLYHVLGGALSPLSGVQVEDVRIHELQERVKPPVGEVILATNLNADGEYTANYIANLLKERTVKITRLASGIPAGGHMEYVDEVTLHRALSGRVVVT
jgi:recombination protein RecR